MIRTNLVSGMKSMWGVKMLIFSVGRIKKGERNQMVIKLAQLTLIQ